MQINHAAGCVYRSGRKRIRTNRAVHHDTKLRHVSLKRVQKQWAGGRQYLLETQIVRATFVRDPCHAHFA
jgi:hypothetical protein